MPKAVYHSGCRDKHNRSRCDSNLGTLSPQSDALKAKFHYTGPDRTRADPHGPAQTRVSDKVRVLCLVGSGRARVVEFSYNHSAMHCDLHIILTG